MKEQGKIMKQRPHLKWERDGYHFAGLFGAGLPHTQQIVNSLLRQHNLRLMVRSCYKEYGDQCWVKIVPIKKGKS